MAMLSKLLETKWIVSGCTFVAILYRRDLRSVVFLCGALCNALFGKILKQIINASRPHGELQASSVEASDVAAEHALQNCGRQVREPGHGDQLPGETAQRSSS